MDQPTSTPTATPSNVSVGGAKLDGDNLDIDSLRELSVAETDREFPEIREQVENLPKKSKAEEDFDSYEDEEETLEADEGKAEDEEPEEEEVAEEEAEEDEGEVVEEEERPGKFVTVKTKSGKVNRIAKDAVLQVKVNGEMKETTLQEVLNQASGAMNVQAENSRIGRERSKFEKERREWQQHVEVTRENMEMLQDLAENGSPEDFCLYYAELTGKDPEDVLKRLVENTIRMAEEYSSLTPRERELRNENRKFKFQQKLLDKRTARQTQTQAQERERQQVETALKESGLEWKDFFDAAEEVKRGIKEGILTGTYSPQDIVEYADHLKRDRVISEALTVVDKAKLDDAGFIAKIRKAVAQTEALEGRMSPKEVQDLIRVALQSSKTVVRESLTKKVQRQVKSGKTNSQSASSRNQEKDSAGAMTLREHRERIWGGY